MIRYGRPGDGRKTIRACSSCDAHTAAGRILALGCAVLAGVPITMTVPWHIGTEESAFREGKIPVEGVAAVMSTAVEERENLDRPVRETPETADAGTEPFGYLDGEWNLWEYIGGLIGSLLA